MGLAVAAVVVGLGLAFLGWCILCVAARIDDAEEHAGKARRS
jgi:hypothetical protein